MTGTPRAAIRCRAMDGRHIWLVNNTSSGSNDEDTLAELEACFAANRLQLAGRSAFPDDKLPTPAVLDAAGIECVAVFAGDGTVNSLISGLAGWSGAVLVLPGGTMNLLYRRLHGERTIEQVIAAVAQGKAQRCRPGVIHSEAGVAYAGLMAGPGTSWGRVREAMREVSATELAAGTVEAINQSLTGEMIACDNPAFGRREGYPLIMLTPRGDGMEVDAYYADSAAQYLEQAVALFRRNFREGPHDTLGIAKALRLSSTQGNPFGLLVDGEEAEAPPVVDFTLAACVVDLLATEADAR